MQNAQVNAQSSSRVESIDVVRGLIMIIMALDHVREFFSYTAFRADDVAQTTPLLFFTRWITHVCAPTFVFLSGISIYLYFKKIGSRGKMVAFLLTRGIWLITVEIFLISFILTQGYALTVLEVIWTIGCSMILLAGLSWLPRGVQIALSLAMIAGHHLLPVFMNVTGDNLVFALLHNFPFVIGEHPILVAYTIIPWVGVMLLGYAVGPWFSNQEQSRKASLLQAGAFALLVFVALRFLNIYGDPFPWSVQERGGVYTVLSFLKVTKAPPSLLFLSVTLGVACIVLAYADRMSARVKQFLTVYGRVPFSYFLLHLAIISATSFLWTWLAFGKGVNLSFVSPKEWPEAYHPSLLRAYIVWVLVVVVLYFPCQWFGNFKARSKAWWASYL
jgi:uncharacterized membrane protein